MTFSHYMKLMSERDYLFKFLKFFANAIPKNIT
jgi:hypothetical protein